MSNKEQPDWDKITEGKIRHGFAVSAFANKMKMTDSLCAEIECWVRYVIDGVSEETPKVQKPRKKQGNVDWQGVMDTIKPADERTDADYIDEIIREKVKALNEEDRNKVLKTLEDGQITKANLDACLQKIEHLISSNA